MRVSVVGLGAGPSEWISSAAIARLHTPGAHVFARTRFFPHLAQVLAGLDWDSFDRLYETAESLDQVHQEIAERLLAAGDEVVLAVPGDGILGEAVLRRLRDAGARVEVLPGLEGYVPTGSWHSLRAIVARLRAPRIGCPWDLEQTHRSLIPYVIEEAYEVVDAIEDEDAGGLADELGDLLLQVALHAEIADQSAEFEWNDVVRALSEKLVRRHPHVFGEVLVSGASDVVRNWDQLKAAERADRPPRASALDGVPASLPQLRRAAELARRANKAGFDWPLRAGTLDKVREELSE